MAEEEKKKPKRPRKLDRLSKELGEKTAIDFGSERYKQAREAGATRRSALRESVSRYGEAGEAMRTIRTGRKGGAAEFFEAAGFDSLSKIAGSLFDKKATKEEIAEARKTLGLEPEKEEKKPKEKTLEKGIVKTSAEMIKKIKSLEENVKAIDAKVSYIAERVSPKIIEAKQEGGEAITVVRYDPLAPAGEQFRQVGGKGKASALKPAKEFMKSAVMKAATADTGMMPNLKGSVSKYKDPEEKSFAEEFKKDPILVLRKDMNDNFEKVFKLLEEQKKTMDGIGGGAGSLLDSVGSLLSGGALAGAGGRLMKTAGKAASAVARTATKAGGAAVRTAAKVGGTIAASKAGMAVKDVGKKAAEKVGGTAAGKAATKAAEKVGDVKSKVWTRFLKFMEKVAPKVFKKVATRLATAGGLALIPGAGWIGSAITVLGSAWLAYDVYQLWSEFSGMSEEEQAEFDKEPETSGDKRGMEIPSQSGAVEGRAGGTTEIPAQYGTTPAPATAEKVTPTGRPAEEEGIISRGFSAVKSFFGVGGGEEKQNFGNQKPVAAKKISNSEGKKAVIASMDKKGITDKTQRAAILAQVAHESGGFTMLSENLNYSAPNLVKTFSYYKRNPEEASIDAKNPVAIGSKAYGSRLGNGPPPTGEGYEFRGRGFIQLTGRANYDRFGITNPDELLNTQKAADNAVDFMLGYKGDWNDVGAVTKYVNGPAQLGLGERESYFQSFLADPDVAGGESTAADGGGAATDSGGGGGMVAAAPGGGAPPAPTPATGGGGGGESGGGGGAAASGGVAAGTPLALASAGNSSVTPSATAVPGVPSTSPVASAGNIDPDAKAAIDEEKKLVEAGIVKPSPGGMEIPKQVATNELSGGGGNEVISGGAGSDTLSSTTTTDPSNRFAATGEAINRQIEKDIEEYEAKQAQLDPDTRAVLDQERSLVEAGIVKPSPGGMEIPKQKPSSNLDPSERFAAAGAEYNRQLEKDIEEYEAKQKELGIVEPKLTAPQPPVDKLVAAEKQMNEDLALEIEADLAEREAIASGDPLLEDDATGVVEPYQEGMQIPGQIQNPDDRFASAREEYNRQVEEDIAAYEAEQKNKPGLLGTVGNIAGQVSGLAAMFGKTKLAGKSADIANITSMVGSLTGANADPYSYDPYMGDPYSMTDPYGEQSEEKPSVLGKIGKVADTVSGLAGLFGKSDISSKASGISAITSMLGGGMVPGLGAVPMPYGSVGLGGQDGGLGLLSKVGEVAGSMQQISALASPIFNKTGDSIDRGSKEIEAGKTEMAMTQPAPVIINNNTASSKQTSQQGQSVMAALGEAGTRSSESAFMRAIAKDFSHPTAFTTIGTI